MSYKHLIHLLQVNGEGSRARHKLQKPQMPRFAGFKEGVWGIRTACSTVFKIISTMGTFPFFHFTFDAKHSHCSFDIRFFLARLKSAAARVQPDTSNEKNRLSDECNSAQKKCCAIRSTYLHTATHGASFCAFSLVTKMIIILLL